MSLGVPPTAPNSDADSARPCTGCGYDLRGLPSGDCPECGLAFDARQLVGAELPWARRRVTGRVKAYVAMMFMVIAQPETIVDVNQHGAPISAWDAIQFQRATILIATLASGLSVAVISANSVEMLLGSWGALPAVVFEIFTR